MSRANAKGIINGIRCNPQTAEWVIVDSAGSCDPGPEFRHFDQVLFRGPEGYWFIVQPLSPEEAQAFIERVDEIEARERFPDDVAPDFHVIAGGA